MKKIEIDLISDIHIDYHINIDKDNEQKLFSTIDNIFFKRNSKKRKYLLISGDIANSNKYSFIILNILSKYYYENIYFVLGNHDYFVSKKDIDDGKYKDSFDRIKEIKEYYKDNKNIHYLDGDIIDIEGIKLGGCNGWYDGSYLYHYDKYMKINDTFINETWKKTMPDPKGLKGISFFRDIFEIEIEKLNKIYKECDILMTHINPSYLKEHQNQLYINSDSNAFFSFNGHKFLGSKRLKYYFYGHTHTKNDYYFKDTNVISNPYGYPTEITPKKSVQTIEINI